MRAHRIEWSIEAHCDAFKILSEKVIRVPVRFYSDFTARLLIFQRANENRAKDECEWKMEDLLLLVAFPSIRVLATCHIK